MRRGEVGEELRKLRAQDFAVDDQIDQSVLLEKFGGLKTFRQILMGRFLDDAWPGKTNHRLRFGDNDVA